MVFNVSANVKETDKVDVEKPEVCHSLVCKKQPYVVKQNACCVVLPWLLLSVTLIMLGCVASWGWKEHTKLQDILKSQEPNFLRNNLPPLDVGDDDDDIFIGDDLDNLPIIDEGGLTDSMYDDDEVTTAPAPPTTAEVANTTESRGWSIWHMFPFFHKTGDNKDQSYFYFRIFLPKRETDPVEEGSGDGEAVN